MQLCRKPAALESILKVASMFSGYFKEKHSLIRIFYPNNMQPLQGSERRLSKHRTDYCCCCCCRDCDAWDKRHNIWNKPGSEVWRLFHSPTHSLSGSIKPWKMTGTCVHWWTRLRLAKCKNCLQVKSPPVFNKQLHSMAPQRLVWRCKISSTARTIDSVNFMLEMISLMASFSKTHCERWRLLILISKSLLTIYLGCV